MNAEEVLVPAVSISGLYILANLLPSITNWGAYYALRAGRETRVMVGDSQQNSVDISFYWQFPSLAVQGLIGVWLPRSFASLIVRGWKVSPREGSPNQSSPPNGG